MPDFPLFVTRALVSPTESTTGAALVSLCLLSSSWSIVIGLKLALKSVPDSIVDAYRGQVKWQSTGWAWPHEPKKPRPWVTSPSLGAGRPTPPSTLLQSNVIWHQQVRDPTNIQVTQWWGGIEGDVGEKIKKIERSSQLTITKCTVTPIENLGDFVRFEYGATVQRYCKKCVKNKVLYACSMHICTVIHLASRILILKLRAISCMHNVHLMDAQSNRWDCFFSLTVWSNLHVNEHNLIRCFHFPLDEKLIFWYLLEIFQNVKFLSNGQGKHLIPCMGYAR